MEVTREGLYTVVEFQMKKCMTNPQANTREWARWNNNIHRLGQQRYTKKEKEFMMTIAIQFNTLGEGVMRQNQDQL